MSQPQISLQNVKKTFRTRGLGKRQEFDALVDLSLDLRKGEILGVVGESGSGKSTLGRCAFGIVPVTSGTVSVFGKQLRQLSGNDLRETKKRMGFVFQDPIASLNPRMYVKDLIAEPMRMHEEFSHNSQERIEYLAARVGLSLEQLHRRPHELSGGQCQRVAIARAISTNPEILLLDEPTSSLDLSVQAQILNLLSDLRSEFSLSYLLISHDLDVISHLSDRTMVLHDGQIVEFGDTQSIINDPQQEYTKTLLRMKSGSGRIESTVPSIAVLPTGFDLNMWQEAPLNRWAFQNVEKFITTQVIQASSQPVQWPISTSSAWRDIEVPGIGSIESVLEQSYTDALLVVQSDQIVIEHYDNGMNSASKHLLQSVSKGILGLLYAQLEAEGRLATTDLIVEHLPEMASSGYATATISDALDMTVALNFSEEYHDPDSEIQQQDRSANWRHRLSGDLPGIHPFLQSLQGTGEHGKQFQYCSANTDLLAWIAEKVCGDSYTTILSDRLWQPMGLVTDSTITVDEFGHSLANGGISMTARDLARFGRLILDGGKVGDQAVLPQSWIAQTFAGASDSVQSVDYLQVLHPGGSYKNQWWITKGENQEIYCVGIYGQYIWIDPTTKTIIVKFSTLPVATNSEHSRLHMALFREISRRKF